MNSEERRAARRARREAERERRRAERVQPLDMERVADLNNLYRAAREAARGVNWKASTQRYQKDVLRNVVKARRDLLEGNEVCRGFYHFDLYERGKLRHISSVHFSERVPQKSLTQNALIPALAPTLIADNSANIKGRGTDYAIRRLKAQLVRHWREHGPEGYVLQVDFSDYFASISHAEVRALVEDALDDPRLVGLEHHFIDVQGDVGLGLGSEPNQILAVSLPNRIDHHVVECCGVEAYGRYMDDSYAIHTDKDHLWGVLSEIEWLCDDLGIAINRKKTKVVKLSHGFTFLKKRFCYTDTGRIVVRPCRDSVTRQRRRLKKLHAFWLRGEITLEEVEQSYQSWRGSVMRLDAHRTLMSMDKLYRELFGYVPRPGSGV